MKRKSYFTQKGMAMILTAVLFFAGMDTTVLAGEMSTGTIEDELQIYNDIDPSATSGTVGTNGNITWTYEKASKTLTLTGEDEMRDHYPDPKSPLYDICETLDVKKINADNCKLTGNAFAAFEALDQVEEIDLSGLDVSQVTYMSMMFRGCENLTNLNISSFDTSNVTSMVGMFYGCSNLSSLDVSNFNTSNVTEMYYMFYDCSNLSTLDVSNFDTSSATSMSSMFKGCSSLSTLDVSNFDTSRVTDMNCMFYDCSNLSSLDVSNFVTSNVSDMSGMFNSCSGLTSLDVSNFDTGNVTNMGGMFNGCSSLTTLNVSNFDTSCVEYMYSMFNGCNNLTSLDLSTFNTSNVTDMTYMFYHCGSLTSLDISNFDTSNVTRIERMFERCSSLPSLDVSSFDTSKITDMFCMFYGCSSLTTLDLSGFDTSNVTCMQDMFSQCQGLTTLNLSGFDTSNVTRMDEMFYFCSALTSLDLSNFDTSNVIRMNEMFHGCSELTELDLKNFNTSNVTDMHSMFYNCSNLTNLILSSFDTSNVLNMETMFRGCGSLTNIDVSMFNTANVENMREMFNDCHSLTSLDLSNFNTSRVSDMTFMFNNCSGLSELDLSGFDTSSLTDLSNMFSGCSNLTGLALNKFDTSRETLMWYVFSGCNNLNMLIAPQTLGTEDAWLPNTFYDSNDIAYTTLTTDASGKILTSVKPSESYQIVFDGNGASGRMLDQYVEATTATPLNTNVFKRAGYAFTGWNTESDGSGTPYADKAEVTGLASARDQVTLYAQWEPWTYTIHFNGNGATTVNMEDLENIAYSADVELTINTFVRPGYSFTSWNTSQNGNGKNYNDGDTVKNLASNHKEIVTLYAQWSMTDYTISYHNLDGATNATSNPAKYNVEMNTITLADPTRTGYTFDGWYSDAAFTSKVTEITKGSLGDKSVYAKWLPHKYKVKFDGNEATEGEMPDMPEYEYGQKINLPENAFKKNSYRFIGWNTAKNGSGSSYADKATVENLSSENNATVTLYAQWSAIKYTITYNNMDGAANAAGNPADYDEFSDTITLSPPTKTGFTFDGWYSDEAFTTKVTEIAKGSKGDKVLYARWTVNKY